MRKRKARRFHKEDCGMSITIKSEKEIELMRESGRILALVHEEMGKSLKPGMSTKDIDRIGEEVIRSYGCIPTCLNYDGFPASICISVNDEVIHGIPDKNRFIREGDIVSLDTCLSYKGYQTDAARTWAIGQISADAQKLIDATRESFFAGIKYAKAGNFLHEISGAIEDVIIANGFSCVRDFVGHGIGREMHEDPQIPNFHQKRKGVRLQAGMTLAIEPMVNMGRPDVCWLDDDWTIVTEDGSLSAHYENTVLITDGEPEILTLR